MKNIFRFLIIFVFILSFNNKIFAEEVLSYDDVNVCENQSDEEIGDTFIEIELLLYEEYFDDNITLHRIHPLQFVWVEIAYFTNEQELVSYSKLTDNEGILLISFNNENGDFDFDIIIHTENSDVNVCSSLNKGYQVQHNVEFSEIETGSTLNKSLLLSTIEDVNIENY